MEISIRKAVPSDIENIGLMYDNLCEWLDKNGNGPGWTKGIYPTASTAADAIKNNTMYIASVDENIAGTMILNNKPEDFYYMCHWDNSDYSNITIIYTLAVSPAYLKRGVGKSLIEYAVRHSKENHCIRLRLDVWEENHTAIEFYKKCGFEHIETVEYENPLYGTDRRCMFEIKLL